MLPVNLDLSKKKLNFQTKKPEPVTPAAVQSYKVLFKTEPVTPAAVQSYKVLFKWIYFLILNTIRRVRIVRSVRLGPTSTQYPGRKVKIFTRSVGYRLTQAG